jgi:tetratricopeptide (TPR) repeat protein
MTHGSSPSAQALLETGFRSLQHGRGQAAWDAFHALLRLEPDNALGHHMVGLMALQAGQLEMGVASLRRSIALDPADPAAYGNLANGLRDLGRTGEALEAYAQALALAPRFLDALHNRAVLFSRLGRFEAALADYDAALAQEGRIAALHNARASALLALGRHGEALDSCAAALRLDPANGDAQLNRASVLCELGRHEEALAAYDACLAVNPGRPAALYYSGTAWLTLGDYGRGWALYEARLGLGGVRGAGPQAGFAQPAWTGETPLSGKTLLLTSEQGLGDTLQFCRYADLAKAQGATVILQAEAPLVALLSTLKGADRVLAKGAALPPFDLHASLMSLPHAFGTRLDTVPAQVPYLHAEPDKVAAWARRLGPKTRPRVGLAWAGGFQAERTDLRTVYQRRDIPLAMLAPLAGAEVDFVSLQKGEPAHGELAHWAGPAMLDPAAELHDLSHTAALIENLDLVITVDTAVAHLAGALGKPVWILNRFDSCWRWMRERTDSPWYPTARLFRQQTLGDWPPVVREVGEALRAFKP